MFWSKCNKLLVNASGELINCNNCPCGYWAVFGFKWRWLDCDTMQPDPCSWNFRIQAKEVKDNKIDWDYCCIEISQNMGLCGTKKGKFNCWSDCYNWDDEGNCIQQMQYCDCIQVEVYNISGCFDKFNEFEAAFWGGCGVTPDSSGNYPAMWQYWYGSQYQSSAASDCVENYWQKIFADKYLLNFNLEVQRMNQTWWQAVSCGVQDFMTTELLGYEAKAYLENDRSVKTSGGYSDLPQTGGWCCIEVATVAALPEINAFITEKINDKAVYFDSGSTNYKCTNSGNLCAQAEYKSQCFDNYYGSFTNCRFTFNWARLKLSRNDQTPADAVGVKFLCKITHTRENIGYERQQIIVENLEQEISINFDDVCQDLPLATNINLMSILSTPLCIQDCDYSQDTDPQTGFALYDWKNEPHITWYGYGDINYYANDAWTDKYQVQIIGKEYIK